jgi:hypothetical protein
MYLAMFEPQAPSMTPSPHCWGVVPELARRFKDVQASVFALEPPRAVRRGLTPVNVSLERPGDDGATTYSARGADTPNGSATAPFSPAYALARGAQAPSTASTMEIMWVAQVAPMTKPRMNVRPKGLALC